MEGVIEQAIKAFFLDEDQQTRVRSGEDERWVYDMVYEAHEGFLPSNWRFGIVLGILVECLDLVRSGEEYLSDHIHEIADTLTDIYSNRAWEWLTADGFAYLDEYADALRSDPALDPITAMHLAQHDVIARIAEIVINRIEEASNERS